MLHTIGLSQSAAESNDSFPRHNEIGVSRKLKTKTRDCHASSLMFLCPNFNLTPTIYFGDSYARSWKKNGLNSLLLLKPVRIGCMRIHFGTKFNLLLKGCLFLECVSNLSRKVFWKSTSCSRTPPFQTNWFYDGNIISQVLWWDGKSVSVLTAGSAVTAYLENGWNWLENQSQSTATIP